MPRQDEMLRSKNCSKKWKLWRMNLTHQIAKAHASVKGKDVRSRRDLGLLPRTEARKPSSMPCVTKMTTDFTQQTEFSFFNFL